MTRRKTESVVDPHASVWIVNHYAAHPSDKSGGSRHHSLAGELGLLGWQPTIIAASTDHGTREQRSAQILNSKEFDRHQWLFITCPSYLRHGFLRLINMMVFALQLLRRRNTRGLPGPDVVIGSTVHPLAAWGALRLARRHSVPFVFEVRDLWPETLIDMGALRRSSLAAKLILALETHLYRQAALIITTMPAAHEYITGRGIDRGKIVWISNGVDCSTATLTPPPLNQPFKLLYFGSHGRANDLTRVIDGFALAVRQLPPDSVKLQLVGDGPLKSSLQEHVTRCELDALIEFCDPVPKVAIPELARSADALVLSLLPLKLYRYGISLNKLYDYLAAGRPILFIGDPINNPVRDAAAGLCCTSSSEADICSAIIELFSSSKDSRRLWGRSGFNHARDVYSYESLGHKLDTELRRTLAGQDG